MGDFFKSPQQRASESLYDSVLSGKPLGETLIRGASTAIKTGLEMDTSKAMSQQAGDILGRMAFSGATNSSVESLISKANQGLLGNLQSAEVKLSAQEQQAMIDNMLKQLSISLSGLSSSSTFGDIFAGLQTLGTIAGGAGQLISATKYKPPVINLGKE